MYEEPNMLKNWISRNGVKFARLNSAKVSSRENFFPPDSKIYQSAARNPIISMINIQGN